MNEVCAEQGHADFLSDLCSKISQAESFLFSAAWVIGIAFVLFLAVVWFVIFSNESDAIKLRRRPRY